MSVAARRIGFESVEVELLRALLAEVKGLRADLAARPRDGSVTTFEAQLVPVLAAAAQGRSFNAREVMAHAAVHKPLRVALDAAGVGTARRLGKVLRRVSGLEVGGVRLERIGADRDGLIWIARVSRV